MIPIFLSDVKFYCVVTSCNSSEVILQDIKFSILLQKLNIEDEEKCNEKNANSNKRNLVVFFVLIVLALFTGILDEELSRFTGAILLPSWRFVNETFREISSTMINVQGNLAILVTDAFIGQDFLNFCLINK